jgi:small subunit ribosomal protein S21
MLKVNVKDGNIERALKQLKKKVRNTKQRERLNDLREYTKPSVEKREELKKAQYIQKKRNEDD